MTALRTHIIKNTSVERQMLLIEDMVLMLLCQWRDCFTPNEFMYIQYSTKGWVIS